MVFTDLCDPPHNKIAYFRIVTENSFFVLLSLSVTKRVYKVHFSPTANCPDRDKLVDSFDGACNRCDDLFIVNVCPMTSVSPHSQAEFFKDDGIGAHRMNAWADVSDSPGQVNLDPCAESSRLRSMASASISGWCRVRS